jgi:hypothetical protein
LIWQCLFFLSKLACEGHFLFSSSQKSLSHQSSVFQGTHSVSGTVEVAAFMTFSWTLTYWMLLLLQLFKELGVGVVGKLQKRLISW